MNHNLPSLDGGIQLNNIILY